MNEPQITTTTRHTASGQCGQFRWVIYDYRTGRRYQGWTGQRGFYRKWDEIDRQHKAARRAEAKAEQEARIWKTLALRMYGRDYDYPEDIAQYDYDRELDMENGASHGA